MREFLEAATTFPAISFTSALVGVIGFWLLVLAGVADADGFDADLDLRRMGLGGVPVAAAVSTAVVVGWFSALAGSVVIGWAELPALALATADVLLLLASLLLAWWATRGLVRPLSRLFADEPRPSARDGAVAVIQVRQAPQAHENALTGGDRALLDAYDDAGEFIRAAPWATSLDPGPSRSHRA